MNPNAREIVKEKLQKLLIVNFIYPTDSQWVSPLVIVPKKNGKLRIAAKPPFGKNGKWKAMLPICRCYTAFQHDEYLSTNMPPLCGCITFEFAYAIILSGFNQNDIAP